MRNTNHLKEKQQDELKENVTNIGETEILLNALRRNLPYVI
jgi:hypothetical protein